jgi:hypothetical protein
MSASISLEELRAAYRRTSSRIYRILEDGYDFAVEEHIIEALNRDALIVDAAFFVLIFGQIENRINELAARKQETEQRRLALRELKFEKRMSLALHGSHNKIIRDEITGWYNLRNDAAHGEHLAQYNIPRVLERADQLDAMLRGRSEER